MDLIGSDVNFCVWPKGGLVPTFVTSKASNESQNAFEKTERLRNWKRPHESNLASFAQTAPSSTPNSTEQEKGEINRSAAGGQVKLHPYKLVHPNTQPKKRRPWERPLVIPSSSFCPNPKIPFECVLHSTEIFENKPPPKENACLLRRNTEPCMTD